MIVSGTRNEKLPFESTSFDLFDPLDGVSCMHNSAAEDELNLPDFWLGLSLTNESGTVLALDRLDLKLLDSLTYESGTTILGFELLDLLDDVSLTNESGITKLGLERLEALESVSSTKLSDISADESL